MPFGLPLVLAVMASLLGACTAASPTAGPLPSGEPPVASSPSDGATPTARPSRFVPPPRSERATVTRVVDGDTLHADVRGRDVTIRLTGIDTPETRHPRKAVQCFGKEASRYLTQLIDDEDVFLSYDVQRLDRYRRTLAYVYRASDGLFVNLHLVARGFAQVSTYPPNVAHVDEFVRAQRAARAAGLGLWSACSSPEPGEDS